MHTVCQLNTNGTIFPDIFFCFLVVFKLKFETIIEIDARSIMVIWGFDLLEWLQAIRRLSFLAIATTFFVERHTHFDISAFLSIVKRIYELKFPERTVLLIIRLDEINCRLLSKHWTDFVSWSWIRNIRISKWSQWKNPLVRLRQMCQWSSLKFLSVNRPSYIIPRIGWTWALLFTLGKLYHSEFEVTSWRRLHISETVLPAHHSSSPTFHHFRQLWAELSVFGRNPLQIKTPTFLVSLFCLCVVRDTKQKNHTSGNDEIIKIIHKDFHSCSLSLGIIIHFPVVGDDMPENIAGQMQRTGGMKTATYAECGGDNARTYRTRTIRGQVCVCHMKSEFTYAIWICMAYLCSMKGTE